MRVINHFYVPQSSQLSLSNNNNNNNNNFLHLYSAFLDTQSALHSKGAISSSTTNRKQPSQNKNHPGNDTVLRIKRI